ncbi:NAD(P)H-binding protein [Streptomyces sp. AV19]|uniref:SDR family oxidoreductase n=1 Tax=Streptomyces sp. AV19 TaxID=2793068 RepID=UPI0018FE090F|nr:NAD(P)H-binding protein [Streptomyces sp. AV19]MBH1933524.1 NAD(P)H-binding protein [Streptomyces sp. AV19]MDG4532173.1 NAD(P)H-binding protein [Streptomyces sp. AV19]
MSTTILVTGGTGTLGRHVVPLLRAAGREVRVLSRRGGAPADGVEYVACDLIEGEGIDAALAGVGTVLHLAGGPKGDVVATRNLVRAAAGAGVKHLVYISVIGADRIPLGYFRAKAGAERAVAESGVPWTTLRAAQFHDLALTVAEKMGRLPVVPALGGLRWQPVDARDVAERLVELALGEAAGRVRDLAGPGVYGLHELVLDHVRARGGRRRPALPVRLPGRVGRAYRAGANLALDGADRGGRTWEAFLEERVGGGR